ncbi:MAG: M48 family metalloprotease, partial [bacterium]|nr:M48 family metalloprotease [bacterium]
AGVMSHEISHVALRHGTKQVSKANILSIGAMLGGGLIGGKSMLGNLAQLGIGLGANSLLLKYSRGAESDADLLGARIMAQAGYNPIEAARFFETLEAQTGKRSGIEQFFSSHPNPGNRSQRIEKELPYMPEGPYNADTGRLSRMKSVIGKLPPPPTKPEAAQQGDAPADTSRGGGGGTAGPPPPPSKPSEQQQGYRGKQFALDFPANWTKFDGEGSVTFAPQDGVVQGQQGTQIGRGVIASFQVAQRRNQVELERDTNALIEQFRSSNPSLQRSGRRSRHAQVDGKPALLTTLYSSSPYGQGREVDLLLTVAGPDGLYYMLFIAPQSEYRQHQPAFEKMMHSVRFQF